LIGIRRPDGVVFALSYYRRRSRASGPERIAGPQWVHHSRLRAGIGA
jgi:hypothetical protein